MFIFFYLILLKWLEITDSGSEEGAVDVVFFREKDRQRRCSSPSRLA
jgi:hypothetical protein